jgi:aminopeptidase N
VRAYIKAHQHGNTVTDDFWRALEHSSHAPVISVAHDFTLQAGVPLIRVSERAGAAHLNQEGFAYDESGAPSTSWRVPVAVSGNGDTQASSRGLVSRDNPRDVAIRGKALLIVNSGQSSYFRTLYDQNAIDRIVLAFAGMAPADQLGLLSDSSATGYAGLEPLGDFIELARQLKPDMESLVLIDATRRLTALNDLYSGL